MREEIVDIATAGGSMETFICRPERGGPWPPVFFLMDAPGIRGELHDMARRLATVGYFVMLPNLYPYRHLGNPIEPPLRGWAAAREDVDSSSTGRAHAPAPPAHQGRPISAPTTA